MSTPADHSRRYRDDLSASARALRLDQARRASREAVAYHPTHPGWGRLAAAVRDLDATPGDPPALMGLDDLDPDMGELLAARVRTNGDDQ